jgi:hypothetical protein
MTPEVQLKLVFCRILLGDCGFYKYFSRFQNRLLSRAFEPGEKRRRRAHKSSEIYTVHVILFENLAEG